MNTASIRTRIAPTPSGYLHLGNLANFLLTERLAQEGDGVLLLRIDDCDGTRVRAEFVEHIFATLGWLGIEWQEGPRDAADFRARFSQAARKDYYFGRLSALAHFTYACACSRKDMGSGPCDCREKRPTFEPGRHAIRLRVDDPALAREHGDVALWRKDDGPAYQWASVIDDLDAQINLIVRGEDLRGSSELQKYVAKLVQPGGFEHVRFVHHPLLMGDDGKKLAKSQGSASVLEWQRAGASAETVREELASVLCGWGF